MKLFTLFVVLVCITCFSSCVDRMDINDIKEGTPTRIDTILTGKYAPMKLKKEAAQENTPGESEK